jgi:hypothetical protein
MLQPNIYLMVANLLKIGTSKRPQNDSPPHLQTILILDCRPRPSMAFGGCDY